MVFSMERRLLYLSLHGKGIEQLAADTHVSEMILEKSKLVKAPYPN